MTSEDTQYRIKIKGHLDARWQDWFDGFTITLTNEGDTILSGEIEDQAALHGVFRMIRNLGLTIISVKTQAKGECPYSLIQKPQTTHTAGLFQLISINKKWRLKMITHRNVARIWGIFFIIAFLAYGIGSGMIDAIKGTPDFLSNANANITTIIVGVILMAVVHTFVNIGLPVLMLPILKPFNKTFAYGYLSLGIASTVVAVVGALFLLLLVPLSDEYVKAGSAATAHFETMGVLLKMGGFYGYQIGMTIWGLGGLLFTSILYKSKVVPRVFSIWGFIGYIIFAVGTISELFGSNLGVPLAMPGGLFEISLSLWLIFKGFNSSAIASSSVQ